MVNPLACPYPDCLREFDSKQAITRHLNATHLRWEGEQVGTDWRHAYEGLYHDVASILKDEEELQSKLAQTLLSARKRLQEVVAKLKALLTTLYKRADAKTPPKQTEKPAVDPMRPGGQAALGSFFGKKPTTTEEK